MEGSYGDVRGAPSLLEKNPWIEDALGVKGVADRPLRSQFDVAFVARALCGFHRAQTVLGADRAAHPGHDVVDDPGAGVAACSVLGV